MMDGVVDRLMVLLILSDVALLGMSRLGAVIGLAALQGALLGGLALSASGETSRAVLLAAVGLSVRGLLFPWLLRRTARRAGVQRDLEPFVGYALSLLIGIVMLGASMALGARLPLGRAGVSNLVVPAALFTMFTGVFLIVARRKALTQCVGYLVLENGIYGFGAASVGEIPLLVELGALLDLFVAVLVMGVAVYRITAEFDHMDTQRLDALRG
ncbi:MAG: hydrogenase [Vicinamibacteria bacterium]|nr:hydrogenase [Vicinamibacteria bacterium]